MSPSHCPETNHSETVHGQYSPPVEPLLASLRSTLANIDEQYLRERESLARDPRHGHLKAYMLQKLERQYQERRLTYVQQVAVLEERLHMYA